MKKLKKSLVAIFCCAILALSCFGFVGCNEEEVPPATIPTTETTPTETTPAETTPTETTYIDGEHAEGIYWDAVLNSLLQQSRKVTSISYDKNSCDVLTAYKTNIVTIKGDVGCIKTIVDETTTYGWISDNKYYDESTHKYSTDLDEVAPLRYNDLTILELNYKSITDIVFLGGEITNNITTIHVSAVENDGGAYPFRLSVTIENGLVTAFTYYYIPTFEGGEGSQCKTFSIEYNNVEHSKALPADLNTYTEAN